MSFCFLEIYHIEDELLTISPNMDRINPNEYVYQFEPLTFGLEN